MRIFNTIKTIKRLNNFHHKHTTIITNGTTSFSDNMNKMCKTQISTIFAKNIIDGRIEFFLPYLMSEIKGDLIYQNNKISLSDNSKLITEWLKKNNIDYDFYTYEYFLSNKEYPSQELIKWLNDNKHLFELIDGHIHLINKPPKYQVASVFIKFNENSTLDTEIIEL